MFSVQDSSSQQSMVDALASLVDLKANTSQAVIQQRASRRLEIRAKVKAKPGNSSMRHLYALEGTTGDISKTGCQIVFSSPPGVGDIYWLEFEHEQLSLDSVLARCVRCRYLREDVFETGFRFFEEVDVGQGTDATLKY